MSHSQPRYLGNEGETSARYRVGSFSRFPLAPHQMQERFTPTQDLIVLCHLGVPQFGVDSWSLTIDGLVARPLRLDFSDLTAYPRHTITSFHQCMGSPLRPFEPTRLISNVRWSGARLSDIMHDCKPAPEAKYVWSYGADSGKTIPVWEDPSYSGNLGSMSNMAGRYRIPLLVIGGGIGGLAAAIAASKAGQPVHVIEKAEAFAELGAGLQLGPNATRMLDRLGILADVLRKAMVPRFLVMMDAVSGQHITSLDLGETFLRHFEYPYLVMHRGDLLAAELAACHASDLITLEAQREVVAIEDLGDGARVTCADGSTYECDALIGADGLWSRTRKVVHDDGEPLCAQYVAYRGTIPVEEAPEGSDLENMTIWVGPEMHFVQYVVHEGKLFNQVAVFRSHRYQPGHEYLDDWGTVEELDERFRTLCPRVRSAVTKIKRHRRWPMFDRLPIPNWTQGHITLLGDAAHPMLQYIAQGACQALEDAVCLGESLSRYQNNPAQAFAAYQEPRIKRSARVQRAARFFGELKHLDGVARAIRNELLHQRAADDFKYVDFLYGYKEATSGADRHLELGGGEYAAYAP